MNKKDIENDIKRLSKERNELVDVLDAKMLDPLSQEYIDIRKSIDWIDKRVEAYYKLLNEAEKIEADNRKCDSDEKVAWYQLIGGVGVAVITTTGQLISNSLKYKYGTQAIQETTKAAFGMDNEHVQSRVASDTGKRMFDFIFHTR